MKVWWALCFSLAMSGTVAAEPPDSSLKPLARGEVAVAGARPVTRPRARPEVQVTRQATPLITVPDLTRPQLRPTSPQAMAAAARAPGPVLSPEDSLRPNLRPQSLIERVMSRKRAQREGMICGNIDIQGEVVGFVPGKINGCGVQDAVRVRSISGVALSQQAVMDCTTAKALNRWVRNGAQPALRSKGRLVQLQVAAHYACRTRNNQPGARISEHGKGKAIDISGFIMDDGAVITVLNHWNARGFRQAMRKMHRTACGPFGTVLGPESDRFHRNHFHFDTASYRSGPYCR